MKNIKLIAITLLCGFFLTGCVGVPATKISGNLHTGVFSYSSPQDKLIGYLKVVADTNGAVSVELNNLTSTNNAGVIASSAEGQVAIINAVGAQVGNAAAAAVKATVKP